MAFFNKQMEQRNQGLLATPAGKLPKQRRKLQKPPSKLGTNAAYRFSSSAPTMTSTSTARDPAANKPRPQAQALPSPTPREGRQAVSCRREGRLYEQEQPLEYFRRPKPKADIVPELAHLHISNRQPHASPGSDSTNPSTPKMRRRAKTPVLSIGQLEELPRSTNTPGKTSSVDLIAEQYQAVLEYRHSPVYSDQSVEHPLSTAVSDAAEPVTRRRQRSSGYLQDEAPNASSPRMAELASVSPMSDDGTLVSFQDETVYFKPISFSPEEPEPPLRPLSGRTTTDDNLSLQICLDLLTRELSSAMPSQPCRSSTATSALQIWVMIEAYERLRDQMAELSSTNEQARAMEMMFDMWLRALYSVHDSMAGAGRAHGYEDAAELESEALD